MTLSDKWKENGMAYVGSLMGELGVAHMEATTGISKPSLYKMARGDREIKLATIVDTLESFYHPVEVCAILEGFKHEKDPNQVELEL